MRLTSVSAECILLREFMRIPRQFSYQGCDATANFDRDVFVRQGEMTMTCQQMRVEYATNPETGRDEVKTIRMFNGVTFASPTETAESNEAVYHLDDNKLIMTGDVLVTQGVTALSSDRLTYFLDSGEGLMEGNVKTVLQQGSN